MIQLPHPKNNTCPVHNWPLKDEQGCWVCYDERRLSGKQQKPKKLYQLPKVSKKQQAKSVGLSKLKEQRMKSVKWCETCGYTYKGKTDIQYSHILPQSTYPEFALHPLNGLLECNKCHHVWTFGTAQERKGQASFKKKLLLAHQISPEFAEKMTKDFIVITQHVLR
jgi:hypothetical protein